MTDVGKEYAAAFFMLARENNSVQEYNRALDIFCKAFEAEAEYMTFLSTPSIPITERIEALKKAFEFHVPEDAVSYIQLMCEKGRLDVFIDSVLEYKALVRQSEQIIKAKVISAVPLTEEEQEKLIKKLEITEKVNIEAQFEIDEKLIGGVVVIIGDKVLDGSLRSRLRELKDVMNP